MLHRRQQRTTARMTCSRVGASRAELCLRAGGGSAAAAAGRAEGRRREGLQGGAGSRRPGPLHAPHACQQRVLQARGGGEPCKQQQAQVPVRSAPAAPLPSQLLTRLAVWLHPRPAGRGRAGRPLPAATSRLLQAQRPGAAAGGPCTAAAATAGSSGRHILFAATPDCFLSATPPQCRRRSLCVLCKWRTAQWRSAEDGRDGRGPTPSCLPATPHAAAPSPSYSPAPVACLFTPYWPCPMMQPSRRGSCVRPQAAAP